MNATANTKKLKIASLMNPPKTMKKLIGKGYHGPMTKLQKSLTDRIKRYTDNNKESKNGRH